MIVQEQFNSTQKKASSRLALLSKLRYFITDEAAKAKYQSMVLPVVTFCNLVNLEMTETQGKRLELLENRSQKFINGNAYIIKIQDYKMQHACKFVRKCLDGTSCKTFHDISQKLSTPKILVTRNFS